MNAQSTSNNEHVAPLSAMEAAREFVGERHARSWCECHFQDEEFPREKLYRSPGCISWTNTDVRLLAQFLTARDGQLKAQGLFEGADLLEHAHLENGVSKHDEEDEDVTMLRNKARSFNSLFADEVP